MAQLLVSNDVSKEKVTQSGSSANSCDSANQTERPATSFIASSEKPDLGPRETDLSGSHSGGFFLSKFQLPLARSRVEFSPLLDLHAEYEEGSLPSPTRENAPTFPVMKPIDFDTVAFSRPTIFKKEEVDDAVLHSYMNDALKAVSSYQQKHGRTSILPSNQLPSPTPSEEYSYEDDKLDEVSSSFAVGSAKSVKGPSSSKPIGSGSNFAPSDVLTRLLSAPNKMVEQLSSPQNQVVKGKSRDPRLRFINPNMGVSSDQDASRNGSVEGQTNYKKHKAADAILQDDHPLKRQRNSSIVPNDMLVNISSVVPQTINKLHSTEFVEVGMRKPGNIAAGATADTRLDTNGNSIGANSGSDQNPAISSALSVSLPTLLKEMDISPEMLMELFKIKQESLTAVSQQKTGNSVGTAVQLRSASGMPGNISSVNDVTLKSMEIGQKSSSKPPISAQSASLVSLTDY